MRFLIPALLMTLTSANAQAWWGHWHSGPGYYYAVPAYYYWPAPVYSEPLWMYPSACTCPPVALTPPRVIPSTPAPKASAAPTPYSPIVPAAMSTPTEEKPESKLPKLDVPMTPAEKIPEAPKPMAASKIVEPKLNPPVVEIPQFKPSVVEVPKIDQPLLPLPPMKSTSNFRPAPQATLVPVEGAAPADGKFRIGFFNFSDRDVTLTVNGAEITLPKQSRIGATVARKFEWSFDGAAPQTAAVPEAAAGAEIVIR